MVKNFMFTRPFICSGFKRNLVYVSCLLNMVKQCNLNSSVLIKSNNTFILSGLMNDMYFLTPFSYSINFIEHIDDEQLPLSKKNKVLYESYLWHF